jgi:hypothetical protein
VQELHGDDSDLEHIPRAAFGDMIELLLSYVYLFHNIGESGKCDLTNPMLLYLMSYFEHSLIVEHTLLLVPKPKACSCLS